jgi:recombination protein RecA
MPITSAHGMEKLKIVRTDTPLDRLSGIGGLPRGFIVELWGPTNSGKSTIAFQAVAAAQKEGLRCLWVDVEHTFRAYVANPQRTANFGVDLSKLDVMLEQTAEEYIDNVQEAISSKKYDVIVMDSIGDLSSKIHQEKTAEERSIGVQASLMTKFVRDMIWKVDYNHILFIAINHERKDMDGAIYQMGGKKLAEKKKMAFRLREKPGFVIKEGDRVVGKVIRITTSKNHFAPTEKMEVESNLIFNEGFSYAQDLLDDAITRGVFTKEGNTFFFAGEKIGMIGKLREWIKVEENAEKVKEALV